MKTPHCKYELTEAQVTLATHLRELGLVPFYERMVRSDREWRFDVSCPENLLAFEINGGQFTGGHRRGWWSKKEGARRGALGLKDTPQEEEHEKINYATLMGWKVLQFTNEYVLDGRAKAFIAAWLK
jgi:hypothetical protein